MPTPVMTLQSARAGLEASRGTDTTPTRILYFETGAHQQKIATIAPRERRGSYRPTFRAYPGIERNTLDFGGPLTFNDAIWWANTAIRAVASGTGAGADKTWAFAPSAAVDDVKSASIQIGYADAIGASQPAFKLLGCLTDELTLTFAKDAAVQYAAKVLVPGAAVQISAFTGALSDRTTVDALGTLTTIYVDSSTIGSTADGNIVDAAWTLTNGYQHLDTLNGSAVASSLFRPNPQDWALTITRVYANDTERDLYVTKTPRKIRIRTLGPTLGGSNYALTLDLYGYIDDIESADSNGAGAEKLTIKPIYDSTATTDFSLTIVSSEASIT